MATILGGSVTEAHDEPCSSSAPQDAWLAHCGKVLRAMRDAQGLTCKAVGADVGLSESHLAHIECATHWPRLPALFRIFRYYKIVPGYPFTPHVPPELATTVELLVRASPAMQAAIRNFLLATDTKDAE